MNEAVCRGCGITGVGKAFVYICEMLWLLGVL